MRTSPGKAIPALGTFLDRAHRLTHEALPLPPEHKGIAVIAAQYPAPHQAHESHCAYTSRQAGHQDIPQTVPVQDALTPSHAGLSSDLCHTDPEQTRSAFQRRQRRHTPPQDAHSADEHARHSTPWHSADPARHDPCERSCATNRCRRLAFRTFLRHPPRKPSMHSRLRECRKHPRRGLAPC